MLHLIERRVFKRFPRIRDATLLKRIIFVHELRAKYPLPAHDPRTGYGNPGAVVLDWLVGLPKQKLKHYSGKYGLNSLGSGFKLIKRIYLHWRRRQIVLMTPPPKPLKHFPRMGFHLGKDRLARFPRIAQGTRFPRLRLGDTLWTRKKPKKRRKKRRSK
jgi:hypothetical protein